MLLHSIGRMEPPGGTSAWLRKYIFPGGYTPAMSEVLAALEHERLYVTDIEILRLHYAKTLSHWRRRASSPPFFSCVPASSRFTAASGLGSWV